MRTSRLLTALFALGFGGWSLLGGCHGNASCGDACTHYLTCAGADDPAYESQCVSICEGSPAATPEWLNGYVATDCNAAIGGFTGGSSGAGGSWGGGAGGGSSGSSGSGDCYPDGHACSAGGDCCNGNCIDQSVGDWICY